MAPVLDRLEGVDLDPGVHHGVLADEALVAEHHPLLDPGAPAQVAAATDRAAPHPDARAEVGVVMDHGALDHGVGPDPDVAAQHRVLAERGARLDAAVVPDDGRPVAATAAGSTSAPLPNQTPWRSAKPGSSTCTSPSRMSWCARR